jgi:hypothetical protein
MDGNLLRRSCLAGRGIAEIHQKSCSVNMKDPLKNMIQDKQGILLQKLTLKKHFDKATVMCNKASP